MRQIIFVPGADAPSTGAASVRAEVLLRGAHLTFVGPQVDYPINGRLAHMISDLAWSGACRLSNRNPHSGKV